MRSPSRQSSQRDAQPRTPASDLVRLLQARHGITAGRGPEPGRVVARDGSRTVTVALVGGRWFRQHTSRDGRRALSPLASVGGEWLVAREVAAELIEARAVE